MGSSNIINFPDRSSLDSEFEEFWQECIEYQPGFSFARAKMLFNASPEEFFRNSGWVYVLGNQYLAENIYKIGLTTGSIERRMRQLYTTGVPGQFDCIHADWFSDCHNAESFIHNWLSEYRIEEGREFFQADLKTINFAFMNYHAIGNPCPSHMVEQKIKRECYASKNEFVHGIPIAWPITLEMEVPF